MTMTSEPFSLSRIVDMYNLQSFLHHVPPLWQDYSFKQLVLPQSAEGYFLIFES